MGRNALENFAGPPASSTSTFRTTGEITPQEFVLAGDYLVTRFPTWSWAGGDEKKRVAWLPADKQYLITKEVPCLRRLDDNFAAGWEGGDAEDGEWAGETAAKSGAPTAGVKGVRGVDEAGKVESEGEDEDEIPDMEDEEDDDEAIIRDGSKGATSTGGASSGTKGSKQGSGITAPRRHYSLYITYSTFYRTPKLFLSGYHGATNLPLSSNEMMEDIMGDYTDKTVTIEQFPHLENVQMASIHPCKHTSVMRSLLDRADAALKLRRKRQLERESGVSGSGSSESKGEGDEWEEVVAEEGHEEAAIRVDQYLVVFLKFMASVTPGIEHDFTMGV